MARKLGWEEQIYMQGWHEIPPDYCHKIELAWEIVTHMESLGFEFRLRVMQKAVIAEFAKTIYGETPEDEIVKNWLVRGAAEYPEAPRAICLAFLKMPN